ncbi:alpha/beta hydrolase [Streptomyces sp. ISL-100]|uniref:alpha/beta hydrolase family protein n=1 Tax=Streptomyces sp. ISL-100 TaxID=2819173 RepID=UPI001BE97CE6|nr:alpha/beta hydrolase [Streptomyces sp. ISL-100]MBT2399861.1 alpha/beta hydrolase [Streptomyces sp. ISL-100]
MPQRFIRLAAPLAALLGLLLVTGTPSASAAPAKPSVPAATTGPELPAPTGNRLVGSRTLHLKDTSRPDPWKPDTDFRELMATVWYPASRPSDRTAPFMSAQLSQAAFGTDALSTVRTHATVDAVPLPGRRPLVVLSPGFGMSRASLTALAEDLASKGYLVAALDHTYEAVVEFPGGRLEPCLDCTGQGSADVVRSRVQDLRFLLDRLTGPRSGFLVDRSEIAVAGHAIGGASAVEIAGQDPRVTAAVNMEGNFLTPPPARPLTRPVLLMGAQWPTADGTPAANWTERWAGFAGFKRWLSVPTAGHMSFSDAHWLYEQFDLTDVIPPVLVPAMFGTISGERGTEITRAYVGAFLDLQLRGVPSPLLDKPSARFPEVGFVRP